MTHYGYGCGVHWSASASAHGGRGSMLDVYVHMNNSSSQHWLVPGVQESWH